MIDSPVSQVILSRLDLSLAAELAPAQVSSVISRVSLLFWPLRGTGTTITVSGTPARLSATCTPRRANARKPGFLTSSSAPPGPLPPSLSTCQVAKTGPLRCQAANLETNRKPTAAGPRSAVDEQPDPLTLAPCKPTDGEVAHSPPAATGRHLTQPDD